MTIERLKCFLDALEQDKCAPNFISGYTGSLGVISGCDVDTILTPEEDLFWLSQVEAKRDYDKVKTRLANLALFFAETTEAIKEVLAHPYPQEFFDSLPEKRHPRSTL
jgi:hypothetical protein